jgi:hypothetical protein
MKRRSVRALSHERAFMPGSGRGSIRPVVGQGSGKTHSSVARGKRDRDQGAYRSPSAPVALPQHP